MGKPAPGERALGERALGERALGERALGDSVPGDTVLAVRGLSKEFFIHAIGRRVPALRGVDLTVAAGEHVALVGPSGAGKSTLLKCVWRSCLPSAGEVVLRRRDSSVVDLAAADDRAVMEVRRHDLGYVSQFLRPDCRRSVLEVVGRAAVRRGMEPGGAAAAAAAALREVSLEQELWATQPAVLSGGEQQRVNLAAGTLCPPRLLLLDEPVAALDAGHREVVFRLIRGLSRAGVSMLSVFHDPDAVRALADRVVVLREGEVAAEGSPDDTLDRASAA
jgi:alpha-D-ribose 1-methylphosphonate 5-triphosphate synthase subunit PhnL